MDLLKTSLSLLSVLFLEEVLFLHISLKRDISKHISINLNLGFTSSVLPVFKVSYKKT